MYIQIEGGYTKYLRFLGQSDFAFLTESCDLVYIWTTVPTLCFFWCLLPSCQAQWGTFFFLWTFQFCCLVLTKYSAFSSKLVLFIHPRTIWPLCHPLWCLCSRCSAEVLVLVPNICHWGESREETQSLEKTCSGGAVDPRNLWSILKHFPYQPGPKMEQNPQTHYIFWNLWTASRWAFL